MVGLLQKVGAHRPGDSIYCSSTRGKTKRSGGLFRLLLEKERCKPQEILHVGDNAHSDGYIPKKLGIQTILVDTKPNRYEELALREGIAQNLGSLAYLIPGYSRIIRQKLGGSFDSSKDRLKILKAIGADIAGPILVSYVLWVLRDAENQGIKRLYFISRDGQILLEIASRIQKSLKGSIELRYLYGSRQAWFLPAVNSIEPQELSWAFQVDPILTPLILARRLSLNPDDLVSEMSLELKRKVQPHQTLSPREIETARRIIFRPHLLLKLERSIDHSWKEAVSYLKQEGLSSLEPWAIVDVGWLGRSQKCLESILSKAGMSRQILGYYFGLYSYPIGADPHLLRTFLFDPNSDQERPAAYRMFPLFLELFTAADHGTTMGYQKDAGKQCWVPILKKNGDGIVLEWGLSALTEGILGFVDFIPRDLLLRWKSLAEQQKEVICRMLRSLIDSPGGAEACALGAFPFSADQSETIIKPIALPFRFASFLKYLTVWKPRERDSFTLWFEGTLAQSGKLFQIAWFLLKPLRQATRLLKRLILKAVEGNS